ncbi:PRD domain-containing protein [Enterococcus sp. LJL120]
MYTVQKVLNVNVVIAEQNNREVVVFGKGVGYKQTIGTQLTEESISKVYYPVDEDKMSEFVNFLDHIPEEYLNLTRQIIDLAEGKLSTTLSVNIYYTLTDHIYFTIQRLGKQIQHKTSMYWEMKRYYPEEFEVGSQALAVIHQSLGVELPLQEAANIAFHIVNANKNSSVNTNAMQITRLVDNITKTLRLLINQAINEDSLHYERFLMHVKFFAERFLTDTMLNNDTDLILTVQRNYPKGFVQARKIQEIIENIYDKTITEEEVAYLAIHINRVMMTLDE